MPVAVSDPSGEMCSSTLYKGNIYTFSFKLLYNYSDIALHSLLCSFFLSVGLSLIVSSCAIRKKV